MGDGPKSAGRFMKKNQQDESDQRVRRVDTMGKPGTKNSDAAPPRKLLGGGARRFVTACPSFTAQA
jgi:hypothetical protein